MPTVELLAIEQLRGYLIAQRVAQTPDARPSTTVPVLYLKPRDGIAKPRQQNGTYVDGAAITLIHANLSGPPGLEAHLEEAFIRVFVRCRSAPVGMLLHRVIRNLLIPRDSSWGSQRQLWSMGDLLVQYSKQWYGLRDELTPPDDDREYVTSAGYCFGYRRESATVTTP
jgi:hypothetical protein